MARKDNFRFYVKLDRKIPEAKVKRVTKGAAYKAYYTRKKAGKEVPNLSSVPKGSKGTALVNWWQSVQDKKSASRYGNRAEKVKGAVKKHRASKLDKMEMELGSSLNYAARLTGSARTDFLRSTVKTWRSKGGNLKQLKNAMSSWQKGDI